MIIHESELFKNIDATTMKELPQIMEEQAFEKGQTLYTDHDKAENFYILRDGRVRLHIGEEAEIDYTVNQPGESFGWSCLVNRECYLSRAECVAPTKVYKIPKEKLDELFSRHPQSGPTFYKALAGALMQRLIYNYDAFLQQGHLKGVTSYGTGQVSEPQEE
jgi:CRP-like cAMP-binding protein